MRKILIFLIILIISFVFSINILACSGSCVLCHKNLNFKKPQEHSIILQCINCHEKGCGEDSLFQEKSTDTSCGSDCFDCHKTLPQDTVHLKITKCIKCHNKLDLLK
jgi:hypothetical protein